MKRWPKITTAQRTAAALTAFAAFLLMAFVGTNLVEVFFDAVFGLVGTSLTKTIIDLLLALLWLSALLVAILTALVVYRLVLDKNNDDETPVCGKCGYNLTGNVSGRCPECGMDSVRQVAEKLVRRERTHGLKIMAMLTFGGPLSFLGPLAIATMFWMPLRRGFGFLNFAHGVTWLDLFVGLSMIMIPLLYYMEMRTEGTYRADLDGAMGPRGGVLIFAPVGVFMVNPRIASSVFVEFFLFGPRLILSGLRQRGLSRSVRLDDRQKAAAILDRLLNRDEGINTHRLLSEGESFDHLHQSLAYLFYHKWIGVGEKWQRIWLLTESRRVLTSKP